MGATLRQNREDPSTAQQKGVTPNQLRCKPPGPNLPRASRCSNRRAQTLYQQGHAWPRRSLLAGSVLARRHAVGPRRSEPTAARVDRLGAPGPLPHHRPWLWQRLGGRRAREAWLRGHGHRPGAGCLRSDTVAARSARSPRPHRTGRCARLASLRTRRCGVRADLPVRHAPIALAAVRIVAGRMDQARWLALRDDRPTPAPERDRGRAHRGAALPQRHQRDEDAVRRRPVVMAISAVPAVDTPQWHARVRAGDRAQGLIAPIRDNLDVRPSSPCGQPRSGGSGLT